VMAKKGEAKLSRCPKCGGFLPSRFIFLPGHVPKTIQFECPKCGIELEADRDG